MATACTFRPVATSTTRRASPIAASAAANRSAPALAAPARTGAAALRQAGPAIRRRSAPRTSVAVQAAKGYKVAVLGAAGGIGQPLSLLLKMQPYVAQVS
jgi:hypothetical protein